MRYLQKLNAAVLVFAIFQSAYASDTAIASAKNPAVYDQSNAAITVDQKHPVFIIKLESNPTTGYSWFLRNYDKSILKPVKHEYEQPKQGLIGAPGFELWTFRVKSDAFSVPHQSTLRMIYARPWEADKSDSEAVFVITTIAN